MSTQEEQDLATQIMNDVKRLDRTTDEGTTIRQQIAAKLTTIVNAMNIDPDNEKPSAIEAKTGLINTLLKTISDTSDAQAKVLKVKTGLKDNQANEDTMKIISRTVAEFAKQLSADTVTATRTPSSGEDSVQDAVLDAATDGVELDISDGELSVAGSTSTNDARTVSAA